MKMPWAKDAEPVAAADAPIRFRSTLYVWMRVGRSPSWIAEGDTAEECMGEWGGFLKWYADPSAASFVMGFKDGSAECQTAFERQDVRGYEIKTGPIEKGKMT